jgi:hypothetical protein
MMMAYMYYKYYRVYVIVHSVLYVEQQGIVAWWCLHRMLRPYCIAMMKIIVNVKLA